MPSLRRLLALVLWSAAGGVAAGLLISALLVGRSAGAQEPEPTTTTTTTEPESTTTTTTTEPDPEPTTTTTAPVTTTTLAAGACAWEHGGHVEAEPVECPAQHDRDSALVGGVGVVVFLAVITTLTTIAAAVRRG